MSTFCLSICQLDIWAVSTWLGRIALSFWNILPHFLPRGSVALIEGNIDGKEPELLLPSQTGPNDGHLPNLQFRLSSERVAARAPWGQTTRVASPQLKLLSPQRGGVTE